MIFKTHMNTIYRYRELILKRTLAIFIAWVFIFSPIESCQSSQNVKTLAVQSVFKPLTDAGIEDSAELVFEVLAGIRMLHAGKSISAVNGILIGTNEGKVRYHSAVSAGGMTTAQFSIDGREDLRFEIAYQDTKTAVSDKPERRAGDDVSAEDAKLGGVSSHAGLTFGSVFQENDVIKIRKIDGISQQGSQRAVIRYDESGIYRVLIDTFTAIVAAEIILPEKY